MRKPLTAVLIAVALNQCGPPAYADAGAERLPSWSVDPERVVLEATAHEMAMCASAAVALAALSDREKNEEDKEVALGSAGVLIAALDILVGREEAQRELDTVTTHGARLSREYGLEHFVGGFFGTHADMCTERLEQAIKIVTRGKGRDDE